MKAKLTKEELLAKKKADLEVRISVLKTQMKQEQKRSTLLPTSLIRFETMLKETKDKLKLLD